LFGAALRKCFKKRSLPIPSRTTHPPPPTDLSALTWHHFSDADDSDTDPSFVVRDSSGSDYQTDDAPSLSDHESDSSNETHDLRYETLPEPSTSANNPGILQRLVAVTREQASYFSTLTLALEQKNGSLICIEKKAFTHFFIPLAKVLCGISEQIGDNVREVRCFLETHGQLRIRFSELYSHEDVVELESIYKLIVNTSFNFYIGGNFLPVVRRRVIQQLRGREVIYNPKGPKETGETPAPQSVDSLETPLPKKRPVREKTKTKTSDRTQNIRQRLRQ
jgi:hypothetical protein